MDLIPIPIVIIAVSRYRGIAPYHLSPAFLVRPALRR